MTDFAALDEPLRVDLPWPSSDLRPNAASPGAWRKKQSAAKSYRADCVIVCRAAGLKRCGAAAAHLSISFHPPDRRRRDLDNMFASIKQGLDAISEVIGVDDYHFSFTIGRGQPEKGGRVAVAILGDRM